MERVELLTPVLSSLIPFLIFLFFLYKRLTNPSKNSPPSPPSLPIIGNLHQIGKLAHRSLRTLAQTYGEIMLLHFGRKPTIIVSTANLASQVLKTFDSSFSGRPHLRVVGLLMYDFKGIIFAPYGPRWRQMRSISVLHLLTKKRVDSFRAVREELLGLMIKRIKKSTTAVNLSEMLLSQNNDVICWTALGRRYRDDEEGAFASLEKLIHEFVDLFGGGAANLEEVIPWMAWINRFNGVNAKVKKIAKGFDGILERIVQDHKDRYKGMNKDEDSMKDLVDVLLELQRGSESIDNDSIKAIILDILIAGTHTSFVTMEWMFTEVLRNPKVLKQLQEEIRGVTGGNAWVVEEDLEKMVYLKAVMKEVFRMHPPFPLLFPRVCLEDVTLNGYHIPAGTDLILNVWAIGRDPSNWDEPESFVPERFLNSTVDFKGNDFELLPFGGGRRGCPGISFAMPNAELTLANLVHQFDWAPPVGLETEAFGVAEAPGLAAARAHPLILVATPRIM